jgi:alkanesulfonate monooxygenase SsuD/methylene tetrahydromethanopterin reductase-like flavin-dependent oxidoreductase (luciferase family)
MKVGYLSMTSYDGPAPGFEIWPAPAGYCDPQIASESMQRSIGMCARADALGFDWVSVSEHHYAPYIMTPNPMVMAGAISQVVKRAKIALLGPLIPLGNPIRIAEEVAMLDSLTGGRIVVLFLRGTPNEQKTFGATGDTRSMTQEGIDLIRKAWTEKEPFDWKGEHYNFAAVSVWPRVRQTPHPPIYGSGNSEESVVYAAEHRMGIAFSFAPTDMVRKWVALYRKEAARCGWTPTPEHVVYRGITYAAQSDELAGAEMGAYFGQKAAESAQFQSATLGGPPILNLVSQPYFVGSAATIIERFQTLRDCGVGVVDLVFGVGTPEKKIAVMELIAKEVLPKVQAWPSTFTDGVHSAAHPGAERAQPAIQGV